MAKLVPGRKGKLTKVIWTEETPWVRRPGLPRYDGKTSRSKLLDTEEQALVFKDLVERAGEKWPPYVVLREHGLANFGYEISPYFVLKLHRIVFEPKFTAEEKIMLLKRELEDF